MKERPALVAVIGYIIGILWGLYLKFSIISFYILILATYYIIKNFFQFNKKYKFKLISFKRYSRYLKLIINSKVILVFMIFSVISNLVILKQEQTYNSIFQDDEELQIVGIIVSNKTEKEYYNLYQVKVLGSKKANLFIQVNKKEKILEYGDKVQLQGEYNKPSKQRNYGGYDDSQYLKTLKVAGRVNVNEIEVIAKKQQNIILQFANILKVKISEKIEESFEKENASILKGLLLGETDDIEAQVKEDFQISNISHVLAISGMHVGYIILGIQIIFQKLLGKKKTKIITIFVLIFYSLITGFSSSIIRAIVMGGIAIGAGLVYRKNDTWNTISISLLGILIYNPFLILNVGLQLSYLGTIGIILFRKLVLQIFDNMPFRLAQKIKEILSVTISAQIMLLPVMIEHFNKIGIYFLITNLLVSLIIGPIIILGLLCVIVTIIFEPFSKIIVMLLNVGLELLNLISRFSELPFAEIYLPTPNIVIIICYMIVILILRKLYYIEYFEQLTATNKRVKNLIALFRYKFKQKKKKYLIAALIILIIGARINFFSRDLRIHFVDVGQGDCTFIVTPQNKTILIDGGGSLSESFDVGEKTLIPYLLDRGFTNLDYIMISHFDQDHVGGILTLLQELKVGKVIISKQGENSKNYQKFLEIIKENKIEVIIVKKGDKITIENDLYFDILWPDNEQITENILNNNSIVIKMYYKNFSVLFTGDIEEIAEKKILEDYKGKESKLISDILKVAHHGSKTSTTKEFLKVIRPKIALIGVGENNKFGHPSECVIEKLTDLRY